MVKASEGSLGSDVGRSARDTAQEIKREGGRLARGAVRYAEDAADERKNDTAEYILSLSAAILSGGRTLEQQGYGRSAGFVKQVAHHVGDFANHLVEREPRELLRDVEHFARQRPALFLGGALLAGLGAARFLKSTPQSDHPAEARPGRARPGEPAHSDVAEASGYAENSP